MVDVAWRATRPLLQTLDPEAAHDLTLRLIHLAPLPRAADEDPLLSTNAFGLTFRNPIGLAPGFDKNGFVAHKMDRLGFGFVEVGTLTPRPQPGNSRPRLFRLPSVGGVINRFGFNNIGHDAALRQLRKGGAVLGINVGANKDSADRVADYAAGIHAFADVADYLTINVSSPNTPGLRDLQKGEALDDLLARVLAARDEAGGRGDRKPVLLKIAPDLSWPELDEIVEIARRRRIDGMIVSNTTVSRPLPAGLRHAAEAGGVSGRPLFTLSTHMLAATFQRVERQFPLIGVGGIDSGAAALTKIEAGASLVQLYSGLVFHGPRLIREIQGTLSVTARQLGGLSSLVGARAAELAQ